MQREHAVGIDEGAWYEGLAAERRKVAPLRLHADHTAEATPQRGVGFDPPFAGQVLKPGFHAPTGQLVVGVAAARGLQAQRG
ncbi:MAG: hypothetical protein LH480_14150 [Rubrivivax sp.]|nr:hypothetical protein [Rubrivivax sp.]